MSQNSNSNSNKLQTYKNKMKNHINKMNIPLVFVFTFGGILGAFPCIAGAAAFANVATQSSPSGPSQEELNKIMAKESFDNAVLNVNLQSNSVIAPYTLVTDIDESNVIKYIDKWPIKENTSGDENSYQDIDSYEIISVDPASSSTTNTSIMLTIIWKNSYYGFASEVQGYKLDGFKSTKSAFEENFADDVGLMKSKLKLDTSMASKVLISDVNKTNIKKYITGWPDVNSTIDDYSIDRVVPTSSEKTNTSIDVTITWKNTSYSDIYQTVSYQFKGFKSEEEYEYEQELIKFNDFIKSIELTASSDANKMLIDDLNIGNVKEYIDGWPSPVSIVDDFAIDDIVLLEPENYDNKTIELKVTWINTQYQLTNSMTYEITGFMSVNEYVENVQKIDFNNLINKYNYTINEEGKKIQATKINANNINTYVDGWPVINSDENPNLLQSYTIDSVNVSDSDSSAVVVSITYTMNSKYVSDYKLTKTYTITGFATSTSSF